MKTTLLILISFFSIGSLQGQFTVISTSTTEYLNDVHFINPQIGYAVGNNGTVVKSTDGGNTWTTLTTNTSEHLLKVQFLNPSIGFILSDTILYKTTDGGSTFSSKVFSEQLKDFHFTSVTDGKMVGHTNAGAFVLSTSDGGDNFTNQMIIPSWYAWDTLQGMGIGNYYTLHSIDFAHGQWEIGGNNYNYNGGDYPYAAYSTDGTLWIERYLDLNLPYGDSDAAILDIQSNSSGDIFHLKKAQGDKTYLYKNDWKVLVAHPNGYFNQMKEFGFLNDSTILIPTNGKIRIYETHIGPWQVTEQNVGAITLTGGVGMVNSTIGYFTGENGKLLQYANLASSTSSVLNEAINIFPNPVSTTLNVVSSSPISSIEILDVNGKIVLQQFDINDQNIDVSNLNAGFYLIRGITNNKTFIKKFIKR